MSSRNGSTLIIFSKHASIGIHHHISIIDRWCPKVNFYATFCQKKIVGGASAIIQPGSSSAQGTYPFEVLSVESESLTVVVSIGAFSFTL